MYLFYHYQISLVIPFRSSWGRAVFEHHKSESFVHGGLPLNRILWGPPGCQQTNHAQHQLRSDDLDPQPAGGCGHRRGRHPGLPPGVASQVGDVLDAGWWWRHDHLQHQVQQRPHRHGHLQGADEAHHQEPPSRRLRILHLRRKELARRDGGDHQVVRNTQTTFFNIPIKRRLRKHWS
ncbi:unnamed protein product [Larinioides sclopetarius]|uniref:Uncharacterized protein n=1 Tax=Larinioides sclopetarius TaxID=280406 RepID=A0AAV2AWS6_9ARAC